ncbi:MAG: hypothetical protein KC503_41770 [Myxococcales bacterium]|nr:hypothetical protein [Myxococcales bacterium]
MKTFALAIVALLASSAPALGKSPLPRLTLSDFKYIGGFRLPAADFGVSSLNYSQGPIAYNTTNHSLFIVGHAHQQAIAEFAIPTVVNATTVKSLAMAASPLQVFTQVLGRAAGGNPQSIDRVGGMFAVQGPSGMALVINGYEYYDAPADNTQTTLVARDASKLASTPIDGYFKLPGAAHASGWISPLPPDWQATLGGTHITGHSSGEPIIGRLSVGPSAFAVDLVNDVLGATLSAPIKTVKLLDYSLTNPLHSDLSNTSKSNDIWTHLSRATYGFVAPGTRTYVTLGHTGGHKSGVCYKCRGCGGYCSNDPSDNEQHYWLYDLDDLVAVKNGQLAAHAVKPYEHGTFKTPIASDTIGGGAFDPQSGVLYLSLPGADRDQGTYSNPPVIVAYQLQAASAPDAGGGSAGDSGPGPGADAGGGADTGAGGVDQGGASADATAGSGDSSVGPGADAAASGGDGGGVTDGDDAGASGSRGEDGCSLAGGATGGATLPWLLLALMLLRRRRRTIVGVRELLRRKLAAGVSGRRSAF